MNLLVIQLARMGDLLQTKRLLLSLAEEGDVHLLVDNSLVAFATHLYPFARVHGITAHASNADASSLLKNIVPQLKALKEHKFDYVYNLNFSGLNLALSTLWPPKIMCGHWLDAGQAFKSSWLGFAFRWSGERRTAPLNLMDLWGLLADKPFAPELVNPKPSPQGGGLGVMLAGRMARRSIPPEFLAKCISAVCQHMGWPEVRLFGTAQEASAAKDVMRNLPTNVFNKTQNLAGATSLLELSSQISKLDRLLTPDTGGMHLAAHHGIPVEAFFLSSAWAYETGPYGEGHRIWQAVQPCLPCLESQPCPYDVKCLDPFKENAFLKVLAKPDAAKALPEGLMGLESSFDGLGVIYSSIITNETNFMAYMPDHERRLLLRKLLLDYSYVKLGGKITGMEALPTQETSMLYEHFFRESDWMLPALD